MKILMKRCNIANHVPTIDEVDLGELAINTVDGTIFTKVFNGVAYDIVQIGGGSGELIRDGDGYRIRGLSDDTLGAGAVNLSIQGEASGKFSCAMGYNTTASEIISHAEGYNATASGIASHAEGYATTASGEFSHAEGYATTASGEFSHAKGEKTTASGKYSHAEGYNTTASGIASHAEGYATTASGEYSHAEGEKTTASGKYSRTEGEYSIASTKNAKASGIENISNSYSTKVDGIKNASTYYYQQFAIDENTGEIILLCPSCNDDPESIATNDSIALFFIAPNSSATRYYKGIVTGHRIPENPNLEYLSIDWEIDLNQNDIDYINNNPFYKTRAVIINLSHQNFSTEGFNEISGSRNLSIKSVNNIIKGYQNLNYKNSFSFINGIGNVNFGDQNFIFGNNNTSFNFGSCLDIFSGDLDPKDNDITYKSNNFICGGGHFEIGELYSNINGILNEAYINRGQILEIDSDNSIIYVTENTNVTGLENKTIFIYEGLEYGISSRRYYLLEIESVNENNHTLIYKNTLDAEYITNLWSSFGLFFDVLHDNDIIGLANQIYGYGNRTHGSTFTQIGGIFNVSIDSSASLISGFENGNSGESNFISGTGNFCSGLSDIISGYANMALMPQFAERNVQNYNKLNNNLFEVDVSSNFINICEVNDKISFITLREASQNASPPQELKNTIFSKIVSIDAQNNKIICQVGPTTGYLENAVEIVCFNYDAFTRYKQPLTGDAYQIETSKLVTGSYNLALGQRTTVFGNHNIATNDDLVVFGRYNAGTASDTILEVGIGYETSETPEISILISDGPPSGNIVRKNAFEIYTDGKVVAPELTTTLINDSNTSNRVLVTKEAAVLSIPETSEETAIPRMIRITQSGYDSITPDPDTLYIIVG